MIKNTDVRVKSRETIFVSRQLLYGRSKRISYVKTAIALIDRSLPEFRKLLNLPDLLVFRISRMKGKYAGKYCSGDNVVWLSPLAKWEQLLETIAHELVHAEQYHQKRLSSVFLDRTGWVLQWNGDLNYSKGTTYNSYRKQPWEIEAFDRQGPLADQIKQYFEREGITL
jgi:hypothetical protein